MDDSQPKRDSEPEELCDIRKEIDLIDKQLLDLIVTRCDLAVSTLDVKRRNGLLATDARREGEVARRSIVLAQERGLDTELVQGIFRRVIDLARAALKAAGGSGPLS
jgi:chorismate mutase